MLAHAVVGTAALFASTTSALNYSEGVFIGGGAEPYNVLNNSCNRFRHQGTFKNQTLYIDGGIQIFTNFTDENPIKDIPYGPTTAGQNLYLIEVNSSYTWDWKSNITQEAFQKKNASIAKNAEVPIVMKGALYSGPANDSRIWLFGGTTSYQNTSNVNFTSPTPDTYSLWDYDTATKQWTPHDVTKSTPVRPYNGFIADVPEKGLGFWINGAKDSGSSVSAQSLGSYNEQFQNGMVAFDFNGETPTANNITGPNWGDPRVGGLAQYVPNYGSEGALVLFGGGSSPAEVQNVHDQGTYQSMAEIWVYDISKRNTPDRGWFSQNATGEIPPEREDSCTVGFEAIDASSYQIFVYGGRNGNQAYDDMYALSLPSFTWTKIFSGDSPRWGHTCHKANQAEMITSGGSQNPANSSACDWETRGVAVYDFSHQTWGSIYSLPDEVGNYQVHPLVYRAIGGGPNGGATKMSPSDGWSSDGLANVFGQQGNSNSMGSGLSGGAIAGIVIGVLVAVGVLLALLIFFVVLPRRRRGQAGKSDQSSAEGGLAKHTSNHSDEGTVAAGTDATTPIQEKDGTSTALRQEKDGDTIRQEMPGDNEVRYEMDANQIAELPAVTKK